jgi:protein gp37
MSDLFHEDVPLAFIRRVFSVMRRADWHQYQILTKRAERLAKVGPRLQWPDHVWMGVSVESKRYVDRIEGLRQSGAHVKFLSLEPLLEPLPDLNLDAIDWVIVGGESGPGSRPMKPEWVRDIRDQCRRARVSFFFKQWGGVFKKNHGRQLDGRTWDQMPDDQTGQRRIALRVLVAS